jgi:putative hemolysin
MITHRNLIEWVDINDSREEIFKKMQKSVHSKFVVADGTLDNVVGILKIREFLESQHTAKFDLRKILTKAIVITENTSAIEILNTFKRKKEYIAVVVDEFGGTE